MAKLDSPTSLVARFIGQLPKRLQPLSLETSRQNVSGFQRTDSWIARYRLEKGLEFVKNYGGPSYQYLQNEAFAKFYGNPPLFVTLDETARYPQITKKRFDDWFRYFNEKSKAIKLAHQIATTGYYDESSVHQTQSGSDSGSSGERGIRGRLYPEDRTGREGGVPEAVQPVAGSEA